MNNLLPTLAHEFTDEKLVQKTQITKTWQPERADPANDKNIPFGLGALSKEEYKEARYLNTASLPLADPNNRDVVKDNYKITDPSPLSISERGTVTEKTQIAMPKNELNFTSNTNSQLPPPNEDDEPLELSVTNLFARECMDIYVQRANSMQMSVLRPNMHCLRSLSDTRATQKMSSKSTSKTSSSPLSILFGEVNRVSATVTGRHQVTSFSFDPGPIGMEVEVLYHRLICTRIVPGSQASHYEDALTGVEVLSVNGMRVLELEEFQRAVVAAFETGRVTIGAAAYKHREGGKRDFAHFIGATKTEFKSLLSHMMKSGLDKDHQHDIVAQGKEDDASSESSEDSFFVKKGSTAEECKHANGDDAKLAVGDERNDLSSSPKIEISDDSPRASDSDSDDGKIVSIRKSYVSSKPVYGGVDDDSEQGMMVDGRRQQHGRNEQEEEDEQDFPLEIEAAQAEPEEQDIEVNDEQENIKPVSSPGCSNERSVDSHESPGWDYATALDVEESIPFSVIVCVPKTFLGSLGWGNPHRCVQFSNYSTKWDVQVCWVDEESAVVPRSRLRAGQKHVEMTSPLHLWILIAVPVMRPVQYGKGHHYDHNIVDVDHHLDSTVKGTAMILRPSAASLGTRRYTSAMWIPGQSLTATQRLRAKLPPHHKLREDQKNLGELPNLMVSIMESSYRI